MYVLPPVPPPSLVLKVPRLLSRNRIGLGIVTGTVDWIAPELNSTGPVPSALLLLTVRVAPPSGRPGLLPVVFVVSPARMSPPVKVFDFLKLMQVFGWLAFAPSRVSPP